jgi:hypothetical protein
MIYMITEDGARFGANDDGANGDGAKVAATSPLARRRRPSGVDGVKP